MLFRIYLLISIFAIGAIFAQANKAANSDRENIGVVQKKGEEKASNSPSEKAVIENIAKFEKSIAGKVDDLEKLQGQAIEFNKNLQKEIFIINEKADLPTPDHHKFLVSRHVEYSFEGGNKIKEMRLVSRHKSLTNDIYSIVKVVSFNPGNPDSIKVTIDRLDCADIPMVRNIQVVMINFANIKNPLFYKPSNWRCFFVFLTDWLLCTKPSKR